MMSTSTIANTAATMATTDSTANPLAMPTIQETARDTPAGTVARIGGCGRICRVIIQNTAIAAMNPTARTAMGTVTAGSV